MIKTIVTSLAVAGLAVGAASSASAANLLVNGGFETGTFAGFTSNDQSGDDHPAVIIRTDGVGRPYIFNSNQGGAFGEGVPSDPLAGGGSGEAGGTYAAYFSSDSTAGGGAPSEILSQTVTGLTVGLSYTFGFDYYLPLNGKNNPGDSTFVFSLDNIAQSTLSAANQPAQQWIEFNSAFTATSTSAVISLAFTAPGNAANGKDFVIDRVYVATTSSLVPEPTSWVMMVAGFGAMGFAMRRKRTAVSFA